MVVIEAQRRVAEEDYQVPGGIALCQKSKTPFFLLLKRDES
jgi:hypothetical protein